jgi:hypothetical protein
MADKLFINQLRVGSVTSLNDVRSSLYSLNTLGSYVVPEVNALRADFESLQSSVQSSIASSISSSISSSIANVQSSLQSSIDSAVRNLLAPNTVLEGSSTLTALTTDDTALQTVLQLNGVWLLQVVVDFEGTGIATHLSWGLRRDDGVVLVRMTEDQTCMLEEGEHVCKALTYVLQGGTVTVVATATMSMGQFSAQARYTCVRL